jgi:hypothetical protein
VLQSRHFAKAKKKSRFLGFVCEQSFLGNADKLNEYLIGVEVYERGADFNPQEDPTVRVQAREIRRSLKEYYEDEGQASAWRIDLPPGHYVPVFSRVEMPQVAVSEAGVVPAAPRRPLTSRNALVVGLVVVCAVLGLLLLRERSLHRVAAPIQAASATLSGGMDWFWNPFLPPAGSPLVVIPNHPLLRAAHDGDTAETLARSHLIPKTGSRSFATACTTAN